MRRPRSIPARRSPSACGRSSSTASTRWSPSSASPATRCTASSTELSREVYAPLLQQADADTFGARELRRLVDRLVRQPLAEKILGVEVEGAVVRVTLDEDELTFEVISGTPAL